MTPQYTSLDQLPITITANQLASAMGISRAKVYKLMKEEDFPTIRVGERLLIPKKQFLEWMDKKVAEGKSTV